MSISAWGTGRPDYSENVEYSTEPVIRSHQNQYTHYVDYLDVAANAEVDVEVDITTDTVVMLYDFYLTANKNVLIELHFDAVSSTTGSFVTIFNDKAYSRVCHPIPNGFPIFDTYRITYMNHSTEEIDLLLTICGLYTSEKDYYLASGGSLV